MRHGTKAEIEEMGLDDLRLLRDWVSGAISKRQNEEKVPLWVVADDWINHAAVPIDQHEKAVEIAGKVLKKSRAPTNLEVKVFKHHFLEHEAKEMLELWEEPKSEGSGKP